MQLLVYKSDLAWPRRSGHDVHTYEMMRRWAGLGHAVHLAAAVKPREEALKGLQLDSLTNLPEYVPCAKGASSRAGRLATRYARYWGIPESNIESIGCLAEALKADAVISSGLDALPLLSAVKGSIRIWYAADEWVLHHLSLVRLRDRSTWRELKVALIKGLYERSYRRLLDRIWVVSELDKRAMRLASGVLDIDIISNGVDVDYFAPCELEEKPTSAVFWGRLDFDPNIQALEWFCSKVWPALAAKHPNAHFTIMGARPGKRVMDLASRSGITVMADIEDLRWTVATHQVVVLPFISGAGVKNKLLEAAALGKAIVCSPVGVGGLRGNPPLSVARTISEWTAAVESLWEQRDRRKALGAAARNWVCMEHTWERSAKAALQTIGASKENKYSGPN
jgi:glycosyltransferase involved in cell wall biosynthesis